jgi:hypothetical protein
MLEIDQYCIEIGKPVLTSSKYPAIGLKFGHRTDLLLERILSAYLAVFSVTNEAPQCRT